MAQHYTQTIAEVLRDFDNFRNPWQLYTDLAWEGEGLNQSNIVAWNNLAQVSEVGLIL